MRTAAVSADWYAAELLTRAGVTEMFAARGTFVSVRDRNAGGPMGTGCRSEPAEGYVSEPEGSRGRAVGLTMCRFDRGDHAMPLTDEELRRIDAY